MNKIIFENNVMGKKKINPHLQIEVSTFFLNEKKTK